MISKKLTKELKNILREDFGVRCDTQEITEIANSLVGYYDLLLKINYKNKKHEYLPKN